jgi:prepilin-type N-terminal cleavage/methylation domain-containing protein
MTHRSNPIANRNGFTLIEMMIVIGIIALLAALTLGISNIVLRNSEISRTRDVLTLFDMALQEWELEIGRSITYKGAGIPIGTIYDMDADFPPDPPLSAYTELPDPDFNSVNTGDIPFETMNNRIEHLFLVLMQSEAAAEILSKILPGNFDEENNNLVVDSWGNAIGIVFPGRPLSGSGLFDMFAKDESGDLTIREIAEDGLGSCINLRPYFVSAGPDGTWGYRYQAVMFNGAPDPPDLDNWESSLDNVYSYEPYLVEESR